MPAIFNDLPEVAYDEAFRRGREDVEFFAHYFCRRKLHEGQADWCRNAEATINVLCTGNRWGKTSTETIRHTHRGFYKIGAEPLYMIEDPMSAKIRTLEFENYGEYRSPTSYDFDLERYLSCKYYTIHTAGRWDQAKLVWDDMMKMVRESTRLQPFIEDMPKTIPPSVRWANGSRTMFNTLGDNGEGIDGHSFYLVSIDEAGWIQNLEEIMNNVARIRVADVQGVIDIVGTMKPGISRDFYRYARRAGISTGARIIFDHRDGRNYREEWERARQKA